MIRRILFATDFSHISDRAEEYTLQIASATGADVLVLHAVEPVSGLDLSADKHFRGFIDNLKDKARKQAESLLERFEAKGVSCELRIEIDKRWHAVVETAEKDDVDLIVLGSHTIREEGKVYLGTTSHKVFFSTDKPLMVVPQG